MASGISSTFQIVLDDTLAGATNKAATIINPGRSFRITACEVCGATTGTVAVKKNTTAGAVAVNTTTITAAVLVAAAGTPGAISTTIADTQFAATDNIYILSGVANITRVILTCVASSPQALTEV